ncbi:hypothetical protein F3Y22_tig00006264pilonHSYRG00019 [Hibiscus syriacus]|uniref:BURP domain-containing protein n=1 Tax=Hibiscus syriacus TaxID=106335 RepID=A0A6A3CC37_HIBSY|nr:hypothetical protein F3Y22_tig00006264pilonHSYRG00019 [Hibiscus syriacus]
MVSCHTKPYPYVVLYCHSQLMENRVFKVSLGGKNGDRVTALAVVTWILCSGTETMCRFA